MKSPTILSVLLLSIAVGSLTFGQIPQYEDLMQDVIIEADLWGVQPEMLSAALGFEGIIGVLPLEAAVRAAGGTWIQMPPGTVQPPLRSLTSALPPQGVAPIFGTNASQTDAMPIVFSWPVLPSTMQPTDFLVHLSDGTSVTPLGCSIIPCQEFNERNVAVLIGEFANRLISGEAGAVYPVQVEIVDDGSPMMLVGPGGVLHSAVGLAKTSSNPYEPSNGPTLVGAKLTVMSQVGEGGPAQFPAPVNDGVALYGADAQYRLRVLTTGGFSPNGVTGVTPDDFARFFRLLVDDGGTTISLTQTGVDYVIPEGTIRIVGLADLGVSQGSYDLTYIEDYDNYIDIILKGDEAAMQKIQAVEIPATGAYDPFYNPGGPGNDPTPGVRYTEPGPADVEPVLIAIDHPLTTTYVRPLISAVQPGPGSPLTLTNERLIPGHEYYNLFSLDVSPGGPGTGSGPFGLRIATPANAIFLLHQLLLPVGTAPSHFVASSENQSWGPLLLPPITLEAICIDFTGVLIGPASPVILIQVD